MFSSDQNIENLSQLIAEVKRYTELRYESLRIDFVRKLSRLLMALVVGAVLFLLAGLAVLFVSMMAAAALASHVGGEATAYALIVAVYVVCCIVVYRKRHAWIEAPITAFLAALFLGDNNA